MTTAALATRGPTRRQRPWLASPSRLAGLGRRRARVWLMAIGLLMLVAMIAARAPTADPIDASLDMALIDGVRHGGDFYAVAMDAAQSMGVPASARTIPLPTLFVIEGRAPAPLASAAMMLLAVIVVLAWHVRFGEELTGRRARGGALLLMLVGMAVVLRPSLVAVPEGWAGLLVGLTLARRVDGRTKRRSVEPVALGLAATMLTPAALPFAVIMLLAAWRDRAGREAAGWAVVIVGGIAALALHARALALVAPIGVDPGSFDVIGLPATLAALGWATGLRALPLGLVLPLMTLAVVGWASRGEAVALRMAALVIVQAALMAMLDAPKAALVVAPLLPLGLLAVPDALRSLVTAALDRRRITVTRVVR